MFSKNDILNFVIASAKDIEGNSVDFQQKLPVDNPCINIPENVVQIGFYEYHQDNNSWENPFNIFVGKKAIMQDLCKEIIINNKPSTLNIKNVRLDESLARVVYLEDKNGLIHIYNKITSNDIVVNDREQLIQVIDFISDQLKQIGTHISHVRNLNLVNDKHKKLENK